MKTPPTSEAIADRTNVFYWQTDRAVEPAEAGKIWSDRHRYFTGAEIVARANEALGADQLASLEPFNADSQTNLGNVNSVRIGRLASNRQVVVRCHPKGIQNGYFHVEATAAQLAKDAGLPGYATLAVHDFAGGDDFAFQVAERLPGTAIKKWLEAHPADETQLVSAAGRMMARLHRISVEGFGPFDNERAKHGQLYGLHASQGEALRAALPFNLDVLQAEGIISASQAAAAARLFEDDTLVKDAKPVLVHNDFADWNLLTDGQDITGILDWDECVGGDAVMDIACWSTFFEPERLAAFLNGYWQNAAQPADFEQKFELMRLRYTLSKMTLRVRRYTWYPTEAVKERIIAGKNHLQQSFNYFDIS